VVEYREAECLDHIFIESGDKFQDSMFKKSTSGKHTELIKGVHLKAAVYGKQTLLTEVRMDQGAVIPPHKHPHEQTGYLVSGQLEFLVNGEHIIGQSRRQLEHRG
jgi:quercetin dioxygenase-like cupin family protein